MGKETISFNQKIKMKRQTRWINPKTKTPEPWTNVMACLKNDHVCELEHSTEGYFWFMTGDRIIKENPVIYWKDKPLPPTKNKSTGRPKAQVSRTEVLRLHMGGHTLNQIAKRLKVGKSTIFRILKENN